MHTAPALLAISHGTSSPTGREAVSSLVAAVAAAHPELDVREGFVDVQQPDVPSTLSALPGHSPAVIVPLLLSGGYHVHVDLAKDAARATRPVTVGTALGPDERLVDLLVDRLAEAGHRPTDAVVLGCAGSSDARAVEDCRLTAERLAARLGSHVEVGFISAAAPRLGDAVTSLRASGRRVVVANYLLAPGFFADLAGGCGADVVSDPLLRAGAPVPAGLVELVHERYRQAASRFALA